MIFISSYLEDIEKVNNLQPSPLKEWIFHPGMLFGSSLKWWAKGYRATCHEGIDLMLYRNSNGKIDSFSHDTLIPSMARGTVLNICDDFLGKSIIISVDSSEVHFKPNHIQNELQIQGGGDPGKHYDNIPMGTIAIVYSHIRPERTLKTGNSIKKDQILGSVADTSMKKSGIGSHLHISLMEIAVTMNSHNLNWDLFVKRKQNSIQFHNPLWFKTKNSQSLKE